MDACSKFKIIDNLRRAKGLTNLQLCKKANVSRNVLYTWKNRKTMPTLKTLEALCNVLECPFSLLLSNEADEITREQSWFLESLLSLSPNQQEKIFNVIKALKELEQ